MNEDTPTIEPFLSLLGLNVETLNRLRKIFARSTRDMLNKVLNSTSYKDGAFQGKIKFETDPEVSLTMLINSDLISEEDKNKIFRPLRNAMMQAKGPITYNSESPRSEAWKVRIYLSRFMNSLKPDFKSTFQFDTRGLAEELGYDSMASLAEDLIKLNRAIGASEEGLDWMDASEPESTSKDGSNGTGNGNGSAEIGGDFAKNLKRGNPWV